MSENDDNLIWSFGYGSNMDVEALTVKKKVQVLDHCPAILRDYRLAFNIVALPLVEPAFANVEQAPGQEVHGVAFCMTVESAERLNAIESAYDTRTVALQAYDGRTLRGYIFVSKAERSTEGSADTPPSKRYLGVLCKGARQAGLRADYVERLSRTPTYEPAEWVRALRASRPDPASLPQITVEELSGHAGSDGGDLWVCCLGYVVRRERSWFEAHKGRDITARSLLHFNGLSLEDHECVKGRPPYPLLKRLSEQELEFITCWLDYFQAAGSKDGADGNVLPIIGYLKEFREQQESGQTDFVMPGGSS